MRALHFVSCMTLVFAATATAGASTEDPRPVPRVVLPDYSRLMRFRAEDGVLVNLTPQGPNRDMFLAGANAASVTPRLSYGAVAR